MVSRATRLVQLAALCFFLLVPLGLLLDRVNLRLGFLDCVSEATRRAGETFGPDYAASSSP